MNAMSRLLSVFFVFTAVLLTLASLSAEWLSELGSVTDSAGNRMNLLEAQRYDEQLTHEIAVCLERIRAKDGAVKELLNGDLTLLEAADRFRTVHADPKTWMHPHRPRPEPDDVTGWCREVIRWAAMQATCESSPSQGEAVRRRLEADLQEQQECREAMTWPQ